MDDPAMGERQRAIVAEKLFPALPMDAENIEELRLGGRHAQRVYAKIQELQGKRTYEID